MKVSAILDLIDNGSIALPQFQRGYVWNREQVRGLMSSLYRGYPVGSFLVWVTAAEGAHARGGGTPAPGVVKLLLDGQQRVTSLYGIIRGRPPQFFDGNERSFTGLYFNVATETFEFYTPTRMAEDPLWVDVTAHMQQGLAAWLGNPAALDLPQTDFIRYTSRLTSLENLKERMFHIEEVTGEDKTEDIVVEIFNRVNSGGTKLSKGDLALARVCATWPEARDELKRCLGKWRAHGYDFTLDWLLRNITTIVTGQSMFSALKDVPSPKFAEGLLRAEAAVDSLLNTVSGHLGLDHDRVLGGRYAFPVMSYYLDGLGRPPTAAEQGRLLHWYLHAMMWGRFAGSTETVLNQDLEALRSDGLDGLVRNLRAVRGDLAVRPEDFSGWSIGARFYPVLYLLTRVEGARDLGTGLPLSAGMLGKLNRLEVHHIVPKARLYEHGYGRAQANAVANFCLLSQQTNLRISARDPVKYLPEIAAAHPGVLESQWIPTDPELWRVENYPAFLQARRQMLAHATNALLDRLLGGEISPAARPPEAAPAAPDAAPAAPEAAGILDAPASEPVSLAPAADDDAIAEFSEWLHATGFARPERDFVVTDPVHGHELTVVDAAWPAGIAGGYTQPVALLLEADPEAEAVLGEAGYRFFLRVEDLRQWVEATAGLDEDARLTG